MIYKFRKLLIEEFDNLTNTLAAADVEFAHAIEWLEYLMSQPEYQNKEFAQETVRSLKAISIDIEVAKTDVEEFKEKALKIFDKKYKFMLK